MAGLKLVTDLDANSLLKLAYRAAQDHGFSVAKIADDRFSAKRGNALFGLAAISAHCDFIISVETYDKEAELVLERNSPWWTGAIGVSRVTNRAQDLMKTFGEAVRLAGRRVIRETEF